MHLKHTITAIIINSIYGALIQYEIRCLQSPEVEYIHVFYRGADMCIARN